MSDIQPTAVKKPQTKSRRRKKRRTEDSSSSESSSSSSSSESEHENESDKEGHEDNIDISMVPPDPAGAVMDEIKASVLTRLKQVPFTEDKTKDTQEMSTQEQLVNQHSKERDELDKKFLQLMTQQFGDDLDAFRKKPDFNSKSLMVLAQTLQSGSNLFDSDEINELVIGGKEASGSGN